MRIKLVFLIGYFPFITLMFFILRRLLETTLIFDQINLLSIVYLLFTLGILYYKKNLKRELMLFCVVALIGLSQIFNSYVLNIDRSRSMYVLSWVDKGLVTLETKSYSYTEVESLEKNSTEQIDQRIREQISRGLIIEGESSLYLSFTGKLLLKVADGGAQVFNLSGWLRNNH